MTKILVTRSLSKTDKEFARSLDLDVDIQKTLEFTYNYNYQQLKELRNKYNSPVWIFTSQNAVKSVEIILNKEALEKDFSQCFAVGKKTSEALGDAGIKAEYPEESNADSLSDYIIKNTKNKYAVYFKGNLSRDVIKNRLEAADFNISELEVYQTAMLTFDMEDQDYEAILFYSPSAVRSFEVNAGLDNFNAKFFAIGKTTEDELRKCTNRQIFTSPIQSTKSFLKFAAETLN